MLELVPKWQSSCIRQPIISYENDSAEVVAFVVFAIGET